MSCIKCIHFDICVRHSICGFNKELGCKDFKDSTYFAEVKQGAWNFYSNTLMECSICGMCTGWHKFAFCPYCGSGMVSTCLISSKPKNE